MNPSTMPRRWACPSCSCSRGWDTVTAAMSTALLELARNPELRAMLREDPDQMSVFVGGDRPVGAASPDAPPGHHRGGHHRGRHPPPDTMVRLCVGAINRDDSDDISTNDVVMDARCTGTGASVAAPHRCLGSAPRAHGADAHPRRVAEAHPGVLGRSRLRTAHHLSRSDLWVGTPAAEAGLTGYPVGEYLTTSVCLYSLPVSVRGQLRFERERTRTLVVRQPIP